ncbi:exported hypothetical protein [Paraburkholderia ribeironis]|uniref:Uncharacterized protein n=1 Tax=Paraburkholderia ribeironis TaxID=1247936 RepID=A0A1N7RVK8_9BURK|nr:exported hypothetical protein [Paraburkholderia ribeironis]
MRLSPYACNRKLRSFIPIIQTAASCGRFIFIAAALADSAHSRIKSMREIAVIQLWTRRPGS